MIGSAVKKAFYMPSWVLGRRSFFREKLMYLELISESDLNFFGSLETKFGGALKSARYACRYYLSKNNSFHKTNFVKFLSDLDADFFWENLEKFLAVLSKINLRVRKLFVELDNFRGNFLYFFLLSGFGKKGFSKNFARL